VAEKRKQAGDFALISAGMRVHGSVTTAGSVRVEGGITGDLTAAGDVALGPAAVVEGDVAGRNISVGGSVRGNVTAAGKLILEPRSVVRGDISAQRLVIDDGAVFDGSCAMTGGDSPAGGGREQ